MIYGGIVGYGAYIPRFRITTKELAQGNGHDASHIESSLHVYEKSVACYDEDVVTIGTQASKNALLRADIDADCVDAIYFGSESHPYAVKPSSTIVGEALGIGRDYTAADIEFACKGGTAALLAAAHFVRSRDKCYALALGCDTAQAAPRDILEYTASAAGVALVLGSDESEWCVTIDDALSVSSDTPDFWRRDLQPYPSYMGRFTGKPAYFHHLKHVVHALLQKSYCMVSDIDYVVFHQPNGKFPVLLAKELGFQERQYKDALLVPYIGNSYSANSLLGLTAILDRVQPNKKILLASYGSGSGCDAFMMTTTEKIFEKQRRALCTHEYINRKTELSYAQYKRWLAT